MKLLFAIDSFGSGGAQRQMTSLALGLDKRGYKVEFFIYHPHLRHFAPHVERAKITIHEHAKRHRFSTAVIVAMRRVLRAGQYDCVLSFLDTPNFYCELLRMLPPRTPLIVSERLVYPAGRMPISKRLQQQFHRLADCITVNSHHQRERMVRQFPWMSNKICTIYNGVDLDYFYPAPKANSNGQRPKRLLASGTIFPRKNALGLIRGLSACSEDVRRRVHVNWVGKTGSGMEGQCYLEEATQLIERLGLRDCWTWLGERSNIAELIRQHDAVVHPSYMEGLPNAICEGMASGLPILASRTGDHAILVEEGVNGFLFDPASPSEMAAAIDRFVGLTSEEEANMRTKSREFAQQQLSLDKYVENYERLFRRVVQSKTERSVR